jgi:hypothetical protein
LLAQDQNADIEATLLNDEERLYIRSAAPGSFWVTLLTKSKIGYKTAATLFTAFYDEGRELLLRRVRANTVLKELEVEERRFDIEKKKVAGVIELVGKIDKIKDEKTRVAVREKFITNLRGLGSDAIKYLPPPDEENGSGGPKRQR